MAEIFISDIQTADKPLNPIDNHAFAMVAEIDLAAVAWATQRVAIEDTNTGFAQAPQIGPRQAGRADGIIEHIHSNTAPGGGDQSFGQGGADTVIPQDIKLHQHIGLSGVYGVENTRKGLFPVNQNLEPVARHNPRRREPLKGRKPAQILLGRKAAAGVFQTLKHTRRGASRHT